ncbi:hypothetical protein [Thermomonas carbonis]|uniref:Uncharacterized protein n=1 Tax=Thermomonas carbonis TaxID=1463158 RepID=A0A7G9SLY8_9GAMM|nr:hypothetical protein [Thermomonas carbonis]QNN68863.1 hypothetical protein H9L16_08935 [Thermomonas carbonis]GHC08218.1 hypothetical protein GCM10010080_23900 [Thermomonas carbonis]
MTIDATPTPRWFALPLLALGMLGFVSAWVLAALFFERQCAWLAVLAAMDMVLLLGIARWPAGASRAGWAFAATAAAVVLANFGIAAGELGKSFGLRPWESALMLGADHAWTLLKMANSPLDLAFYIAGLLVALAAGFSARRRGPSAR